MFQKYWSTYIKVPNTFLMKNVSLKEVVLSDKSHLMEAVTSLKQLLRYIARG